MAIGNRWKEVVAATGLSQNAFADKIGMNRGAFSRVCNGMMVMSEEEVVEADNVLVPFGECVASAYDKETFRIICGRSDLSAKRPPVKVRLYGYNANLVDACVSKGLYPSRDAAVNAIVGRSFADGSVEK